MSRDLSLGPTAAQLLEFVKALHTHKIAVTDFEQRFIEDTLKRHLRTYRPDRLSFSPGQREVILKMQSRYAIQLPVGTRSTASPSLEESATPFHMTGMCAFLIRREGEAYRAACGSPAVGSIKTGVGRLELCAEHLRAHNQRIESARRQRQIGSEACRAPSGPVKSSGPRKMTPAEMKSKWDAAKRSTITLKWKKEEPS